MKKGSYKKSSKNQANKSQKSQKRKEVKEKKTQTKGASNPFDFVIALFLVALLGFYPMFFWGKSFQGIAFEKQMFFYVFILSILFLWLLRIAIRGSVKIKQTPLDWLVIFFIFVYGACSFFSLDRWHSFWGFFGDPSRGFLSILAIGFFYFLINVFLTRDNLKLFFGSVIFSGFLVFIILSLELFGLGYVFGAGNSSQSFFLLFGSVSNLAVFVGMMIPLLVILAVKIQSETGGFGSRAFLFFVLAVLGISFFILFKIGSFVFWPAFLVSFAFFLFYVLSLSQKNARSFAFFLSLLVFLVFIFLAVFSSKNDFSQKFSSDVSIPSEAAWKIAKSSLDENFMFGSGPATYGYSFSKFKPASLNYGKTYNLKLYQGPNLFFEMISGLGFLGIVAGLLLLCVFLVICVYMLFSLRQKSSFYSLGLFCSVLIFVLSAFFIRIEGPLFLWGFLIACFCLAAFLVESGASQKSFSIHFDFAQSPRFFLLVALFGIMIFSAVLFGFFFLGKTVYADYLMKKSFEQKETPREDLIEKMKSAAELNSKEGRYQTFIGQQYLLVANEKSLKSTEQENSRQMREYLDLAIEASFLGRELMEKDVLAVESLARVYEGSSLYIKGALDNAEQEYENALALEPASPSLLLKLGQIKVARAVAIEDEEEKNEMMEAARDFFEQALSQKQDLGAAYFNLALLFEVAGDLDGAIWNMKKAAEVDSQNSDFLFNLGRLYRAKGGAENLSRAENIFRRMIFVKEKELNARLNLGIVLEEKGEEKLAKEQYEEIALLLSADQEEQIDAIFEMIENIEKGIGNSSSNLGVSREISVPGIPAVGL